MNSIVKLVFYGNMINNSETTLHVFNTEQMSIYTKNNRSQVSYFWRRGTQI